MTENPNDRKTALAADRTSLARVRVALALDRTSLAWIRTALTFSTFGFGMIGYFRTLAQAHQTDEAERIHQAAIHMGVALVIIGLVATALAAISQWRALGKLRRGERIAIAQWPLTLTIVVLVAIVGLYGLWYIRVWWM
jgi:putative membrane protein